MVSGDHWTRRNTEAPISLYGELSVTNLKRQLLLSGMLNLTVTPLGKKLLYSWMLRPLLDFDRIAERHNAVDLFAHPDFCHQVADLCRSLKTIKNVNVFCSKISRGRGTWRD